MTRPSDNAIEFVHVSYRLADNINSMPFISSDHFMDMLFDGPTAGLSGSSHVFFGSMAMSPVPTMDITNGKIAHITVEVDAKIKEKG